MSDLRETQAVVIQALVSELQNPVTEGQPLIKVLSEDLGFADTTFTSLSFAGFFHAYRMCWARSAPDSTPVTPQDVLAEMEKAGIATETIDKWRIFIFKPQKPISPLAAREHAISLINADVGRAAKVIFDSANNTLSKNPANVREELVAVSNALMSLSTGQGEEARPSQIMAEVDSQGFLPPVSTGWPRMDEALAGGGQSRFGGIRYHEGDIWVVGAPSGHGKSSFGCNLAVNLLVQGHACIYVTWEMAKEELVRRMMCNLGDIDYDVAQDSRVATSQRELDSRASAILQINEGCRLYERPQTPAEIAEVIHRHKWEFGDRLKVVIIDHIGVPRAEKGRDPWYHLESMTYALKAVAKQEHVALICFSQVPQDVEEQLRDKNKATSTSFRGSRGIKMAVDLGLFMCRHNGKDEMDVPRPEFFNTTCFQVIKDRRFGDEDWFMMSYDRNRFRLIPHTHEMVGHSLEDE
ncbi:MAG: DnaB-like helicase C-terminal domain-containing protein [Candidatus Paceibacterota bacterium]|jgi:replicative DNA helicase